MTSVSANVVSKKQVRKDRSSALRECLSLTFVQVKDKIAKANSLKTAVVLFGEYSEKGMHELYDVSSKIIDGNSWNGYGCQCMTVAVNTADENITYYVYMAAKKSECWYEYDD